MNSPLIFILINTIISTINSLSIQLILINSSDSLLILVILVNPGELRIN